MVAVAQRLVPVPRSPGWSVSAIGSCSAPLASGPADRRVAATVVAVSLVAPALVSPLAGRSVSTTSYGPCLALASSGDLAMMNVTDSRTVVALQVFGLPDHSKSAMVFAVPLAAVAPAWPLPGRLVSAISFGLSLALASFGDQTVTRTTGPRTAVALRVLALPDSPTLATACGREPAAKAPVSRSTGCRASATLWNRRNFRAGPSSWLAGGPVPATSFRSQPALKVMSIPAVSLDGRSRTTWYAAWPAPAPKAERCGCSLRQGSCR